MTTARGFDGDPASAAGVAGLADRARPGAALAVARAVVVFPAPGQRRPGGGRRAALPGVRPVRADRATGFGIGGVRRVAVEARGVLVGLVRRSDPGPAPSGVRLPAGVAGGHDAVRADPHI